MTTHLDFKAIGYGLVTFILGYMLMSVVGTAAVDAGDSSLSQVWWGLLQLAGNLVPVAAGAISAYRASRRPLLQGIIGGGIGILFFVPGMVMASHPAGEMLLVVGIYAMLAALGAIIGKYVRSRVGP